MRATTITSKRQRLFWTIKKDVSLHIIGVTNAGIYHWTARSAVEEVPKKDGITMEANQP